ncbi:MAG TPA: glycosyltransferase family 87 protein [Candidatus Limnocylindrales bacterium]|jgi:hypothetical protein
MTDRPISRAGLAAALLPVAAIATFALVVGATLFAGAAAGTLGYDYLAYDAAARRLLAGQPLYDTSFQTSGTFGLFYYPPPFILIVLPFTLLPASAATWAWIGALVACFAAGVVLLPVSTRVRWLIVLAAAIQWPFAYALKLGQVGPLLFLCFAVGWRWLDRALPLGGGIAVGALVKIQPALLIVWAALSGRRRAAGVAVAIGLVVALVTTLLTGFGAWFDFADLVRRVSDPITTPKNLTPGAVAYQLGLERGAAAGIQLAATVAVLGLVVVSARRSPAAASFLVAVIASQLVSPILWDHYAMLILLPVAWLLERRQWWALLGPVLTSVPLFGLVPPAGYLATLVVACLAPWLVSLRASASPAPPTPASLARAPLPPATGG